MVKYVLCLLYWLDTTLQMFLLKIITSNYGIDNIIFYSVLRAIYLPYFIIRLIKNYKINNMLSAKWFDIVNGILEQLDTLTLYIGYSGLTIAEYITYRTFGVFLGGIYLMLYYRKILPVEKIISMCLICIACIILLGFYNKSNIYYSLICILSAVAYSLTGFIIEVNVKTTDEQELNFYWTKTISYVIALFVGMISEYEYKTIYVILSKFSVKNIVLIVFIELIVGFLECVYYSLKITLIGNYPKNGSIITQFLDIMRRFALIILGVLFFSEVYNTIIYVSVFLMFLGSIIGMINYEDLKFYYNKYIKRITPENKNTQDNIFIIDSGV